MVHISGKKWPEGLCYFRDKKNLVSMTRIYLIYFILHMILIMIIKMRLKYQKGLLISPMMRMQKYYVQTS